jgi:predicted nucleic acid-binding Zn ribbon protein
MYNQRLDSMIHRPCMYQHTCSQKCDLERERERERERESTQKLEKEAVASVAVDVVVGRA